MDAILLKVVLPLSLAFIMLTLGLGLRIADFGRVIKMPKAFFLGLVNQMVLLPLVAFGIAVAAGLPELLAVGFMILALSPGGVTTNVLTKLAKGNTALSISLTAVVTLLSVATVPFWVGWSVDYFMAESAPSIDTMALSQKMVLLTLVPVLLGMFFNRVAPRAVSIMTPWLSKLAVGLFAAIVLLAILANKGPLLENLSTLGPAVVGLMVSMLLIGIITGKSARLSFSDQTTVAIETGIQNGTLGIAVAALVASQLLGQVEGMSMFALPSAVYGSVMYLIGVPFVLWRRKMSPKATEDNRYHSVPRFGRLSMEPKRSNTLETQRVRGKKMSNKSSSEKVLKDDI